MARVTSSWEGKQTLKILCSLYSVLIMNILYADLRKQARQLENEIDGKLVNYSKLGSGPTLFNNSVKPNG